MVAPRGVVCERSPRDNHLIIKISTRAGVERSHIKRAGAAQIDERVGAVPDKISDDIINCRAASVADSRPNLKSIGTAGGGIVAIQADNVPRNGSNRQAGVGALHSPRPEQQREQTRMEEHT